MTRGSRNKLADCPGTSDHRCEKSTENKWESAARPNGNASGRRAVLALGVLTLLLTATPALAQESRLAEDLDRYWSGAREMPVIAGDRLYITDSRFEVEVFGGVLPNDAFYTYYPVGLNAGYHFDSIWGAELGVAYVDLKGDSKLTSFLVDKGASIRQQVDLGDEQILRADLVGTFSPLYGKWSFQTYKISHFDLFFLAGGGIVLVKEPEVKAGNIDPEPQPVTAIHPEGVFGAGFRFFALDWMAIRLDARWYIYPAFDGVSAPAQITLGLSFLTPQL